MTKQVREELADDLDMYDIEIGDDDYGFIFGPDGELKSVFLPDDLPFQVPEKIAKILELFGVQDPEQLDDPILH
jgi:hypothetical protein